MLKLTKKTISDFGRITRLEGNNEIADLTGPFWAVLGGGTSVNLLKVPTCVVTGESGEEVEVLDISQMANTPFDPNSKYLRFEGRILPNPFYLRLYKIVELFKDKDNSSLGLFFDLDAYAYNLHFLMLGKTSIENVMFQAETALGVVWGRAVTGHHKGFVSRAVAHVRCDIPENHVVIDKISANNIATELGLSTDQLNGMILAETRFPTVDADSCQKVVIRVCDTRIRHIGTHPILITKQGGDNDGDTLNIHELKEYLGKIEGLGNVDSVRLTLLGKLENEKFPKREFSDTLTTAIGLGSNQLQGLITNPFERMGLACFLALHLKPTRVGKVSEEKAIEIKAHNAHLAKTKKIILNMLNLKIKDLVTIDKRKLSSMCQKLVKSNGLGALTEITMDRRKYAPGDPDRYDDILLNFISIALGKADKVNIPAIDRLNKAGGKDGRMINGELIQAILDLSGTPVKFLREYPVTNCLVGNMNSDKLAGLAESVSKYGIEHVLKVCMGDIVEKAVPYEEEQRSGSGGSGEIRVRGEGPRPKYNGIGRKYLQDCIAYENKTDVFISVLPGSTRLVIAFKYELNGIPDIKYASMRDPRFEYLPDGIGRFGFYQGNSYKIARNIIRCNNINAGRMTKSQKQINFAIQFNDLEMVTIIDVIASEIVSVAETIQMLLDEGEALSQNEIHAKVNGKIRKLMDEFGRLSSGESDEDEFYTDVVDIGLQEASVQLIQGSQPWDNLLLFERMMTVINGRSFVDPITGVVHDFSVGVTSKNKPGTVITKIEKGLKRTLVEYSCNPWSYNAERERREVRTNRMAKTLRYSQHLITSRFDSAFPDLLNKSTDLVIAFVNGEGLLKVGEYNPDAAFMTETGYKKTKSETKPRNIGPFTEEEIDMRAAEILGLVEADMSDLLAAGWTYRILWNEIGQVDGHPVQKASYILTSPDDMPQSFWKKLAFQGHKTVAMPIQDEAHIIVNGIKQQVDVLIDIDTIKNKKMEYNILFGFCALLGYRKFNGDETIEQMREVLSERMKKYKLTSPILPLYNGDTEIGDCYVGLFRTFVLNEDENISSGFRVNAMSWNPAFTRLMGEDLKVSKFDQERIQMLSDFIG